MSQRFLDLVEKYAPGWKLKQLEGDEPILGLCDYSARTLYVRFALDISTLIHEIAHVLEPSGQHGVEFQAKFSYLMEEEGIR